MGVCPRRFCLNIKVVGDICLFYVGPGYDKMLWEFCFGVMYGGWYGVCDFVVNVFHVVLIFASSMVMGFVSMSVV